MLPAVVRYRRNKVTPIFFFFLNLSLRGRGGQYSTGTLWKSTDTIINPDIDK